MTGTVVSECYGYIRGKKKLKIGARARAFVELQSNILRGKK
jgi:hypothetical protein